MRDIVQQLKAADISSEIYVVAPTQIETIAQMFGDAVADAMNMRTFAPKIRTIAEKALRDALHTARHSGARKQDKN